MKKEKSHKRDLIAVNALLGMIALVTACGNSGKLDLNKEYKPEYRSYEYNDLNYKAVYNLKTFMEMQGQPMNAERVFDFTYAFSGKEAGSENGHLVSITLENIDAKMITALGQQKFDTRHINGKSFDMMISADGRKLSYPHPDQLLRLDMGAMAGGVLNLEFILKYNFPGLPDSPVKGGETWPETFQRTQIEGSLKPLVNINAVHQYVDVEKVDGYDCLKVESTYKAEIEGSEEQMGTNWTYIGKLEGSSTWYFAIKEGFVVKVSSKEKSKGIIKSTGDNPMDVPIQQEISVDINIR